MRWTAPERSTTTNWDISQSLLPVIRPDFTVDGRMVIHPRRTPPTIEMWTDGFPSEEIYSGLRHLMPIHQWYEPHLASAWKNMRQGYGDRHFFKLLSLGPSSSRAMSRLSEHSEGKSRIDMAEQTSPRLTYSLVLRRYAAAVLTLWLVIAIPAWLWAWANYPFVGIIVLLLMVLVTLPPVIVSQLIQGRFAFVGRPLPRLAKLAAASLISVGWTGLLVAVKTTQFGSDPPMSLDEWARSTMTYGGVTTLIVLWSVRSGSKASSGTHG